MAHHPDSTRLNKAISDSGFCSRRQADTYIEKGLVTVNGEVATLGDRAMPGDEIRVEGKLITENDFINHKERIFHIGRLDKPSEGLLLMTNDGDIVNKILRAGNDHEKEYIVKVDRPITDDFINRMRNGIYLEELETVTKKCTVEKISRFVFRIVLVQGLNRQIRRMCDYLEYEVVSLQRIRIMNIELGNLPVGKWRDLTKEELKGLQDSLKDSENSSFVDVQEKKTQGKRRNR